MMLTFILALAVLKHIMIAFDVSSSLLRVTLEGQESHQKCRLLMTKPKSDINFVLNNEISILDGRLALED